MTEMENGGLDEELGISEKKEAGGPKLVKDERRPFYEWEVGGETYRMKLTTNMTCKLEEKYKTNLLNLISSDSIPKLSVMLTIVQAAMIPWHHGTDYKKVQGLFDKYVEEGGDQLTFYAEVVMGALAVSGFFTKKQARELTDKNLTEEMDMRI